MDKKIEQLFYAALGCALTVKEKVEANNDEIKACQEKSEATAREFIDEMSQRGEQEKQAFQKMFKDTLKELVTELDLATREDLEKLKQELVK
jgi:polyhydroxyalkanoate synthesis regulator phasin